MTGLDREFLGCGRKVAAGGSGPENLRTALLGEPPVYAPDRPFDTCHVYLDVDVDLRRRRLSGVCRTTIKARRGGLRSLSFDAVGLSVSKVLFDGEPVRFRNDGKKLAVAVPRALVEGRAHDVEVQYRVEDPEAGLHFVENPAQMWSQSQPEDARRWFPCHDAPGEKATSEIRAAVPAGFRAVSNGVLVEQAKKGVKRVWHWRMDRPHSIYLISLVVGRFAEIESEWNGIPIVYYCEKGREADARRGFGKTAAAMRILSEKTGVRYPYARYAQVAVAEYPGGMEHTTAATQTDACLIDKQAFLDHDLDTLIAHELAHQWFGDLVTCAEWPHAWLNEGFATYSEVIFLEADRGRDEALFELLQNRRAYLDEDSGRYRRPIVCRTYADPWTIFDRHLYEKGCWVLRMLHLELGDHLFWKGVGHWLNKHRDGTAETQDLVAAFEEATGRNLQGFFDQWVYRGGHPVLRLRWSWDQKTRRGELHLVQTQDVSDSAPAYRFKAHIRVTGRGWTRDLSESIDSKEHRLVWSFPDEPVDVEFDPDLELLASIRFHKPQAYWRRQLRAGKTAVSRALAASMVAAWGGEQAVAELEAAAKREKFWGASAEIILALGRVSGHAPASALRRLLGRVEHPKARRAIIEQLGLRGAPADARRLAPSARSATSLLVRAEATRALGRLDYGRHRRLIEANLKASTYRDGVAAAAVSALAASRAPEAAKKLLALAKRPNRFGARVAAIRALAEYATTTPDAVPVLLDLMSESDERIGLAACAALGRANDERALPRLEKAAKSAGNPRIRVYATESIARIKAGAKTRSKLAGKRVRA
ncbi:MAG: M1 family metallopeptidase [Elusimicrobia bacterium]|nr:M1 family metallopeptidase [Elusimicrobiota bacterium]